MKQDRIRRIEALVQLIAAKYNLPQSAFSRDHLTEDKVMLVQNETEDEFQDRIRSLTSFLEAVE